MNTNMIIASLVGMTVTVGAVAFVATDITDSATAVVDSANFHQLATALEVYYAVNQAYPQVRGGDELVNALFDGEYIRNKPLEPAVFVYESKDNGQDYSLKVARVEGRSTNGDDQEF